MLAAPSFLGALPVQRGVGFDVDNLVGLAIVFFAVIWPVIRGLLNAAKSNRQDFQARSKAGSEPTRPNPLEAFLQGLQDDGEEEVVRERRAAREDRAERREAALERQRARRERAALSPSADPFETESEEVVTEAPVKAPVKASVEALPKEQPSSVAPSTNAPATRARRRPEPVDGFEVAIDDDLDAVPSEDALEADLFARPQPARRGARELEPDEEGLEVLEGAGERAAFALESKQGSPLERIQTGRSPWRSAILMKEILGPPISVKPHDDQLL